MSKECPRCEKVLSLSEFCKNKRKSDGLNTYCRSCAKQMQRESMIKKFNSSDDSCDICGVKVTPGYNRCRTHSQVGRRGGRWKGGRHLDKNGYTQIWDPGHPNSNKNGYVLEHRQVMSNHLDRPLTSDESVHHKNGIRTDNRIENLELWSRYQPTGQRVQDLVAWAREILDKYPEFLEE